MINGLTIDEINAISKFIDEFNSHQIDMDKDINKVVNDNFWELL